MDRVEVRFSQPTKLGDAWKKPGDDAWVSAEERDLLAAENLIEGDAADGALIRYLPNGDLVISEGTSPFSDLSEAEIEALIALRLEQLMADLAAAELRAKSAEASCLELQKRIVELETARAQERATETSPDGQPGEQAGTEQAMAQSAAGPADENTPPSPATKTASKKGAAATPKG